MLRLLLITFLLAFALRAGWGVASLVRQGDVSRLSFPDEEQYWRIAGSLARGEGLVDELGLRATRMPLYPGFLSLCYLAGGPESGAVIAKAVQWVFGAAAAPLVSLLAGSMFDRRAAWLAGLLTACDPFLVFFASLLLTETLFVTGLAGLWFAAWQIAARLRPRDPGSPPPTLISWIACGAVAAFCVYARESSLGLVVLLAVWLAGIAQRRRDAGLGALLIMGVVVATLAPWAARNERVLGEVCWLTTNSGISLYDGVRAGATGASDLAEVKQAEEVRALSETERNRYFQRAAWQAVRNDPVRALRLGLAKWKRMWNPFPNVATYQSASVRLISAAWTVPMFAAAVVGVIMWPTIKGREGTVRVALLLLPAVYLTLLHGLFVGSVRYRLGAVPMLAVLASACVCLAWDAIRRRGAHRGA